VRSTPKCANSSSNHNLKRFGTWAIFFYDGKLQTRRTSLPTIVWKHEQTKKFKRKKITFTWILHSSQKKLNIRCLHYEVKNVFFFWIQRSCEFQSNIVHYPPFKNLEMVFIR
jgi:hypothetical protein